MAIKKIRAVNCIARAGFTVLYQWRFIALRFDIRTLPPSTIDCVAVVHTPARMQIAIAENLPVKHTEHLEGQCQCRPVVQSATALVDVKSCAFISH